MMSIRKDIHHRVPANIVADFKRTAKILGLKEWQALEIALSEWNKRHHDEAQKRIDMYVEKGIVINRPEGVTINIAVFQKAEVLLAKEELQRLLTILPDVKDPASRRETQLELAKALKVIQPVFVKTRDTDLAELLKQAEEALQQ
jgi:hypothetical protein